MSICTLYFYTSQVKIKFNAEATIRILRDSHFTIRLSFQFRILDTCKDGISSHIFLVDDARIAQQRCLTTLVSGVPSTSSIGVRGHFSLGARTSSRARVKHLIILETEVS